MPEIKDSTCKVDPVIVSEEGYGVAFEESKRY